MLEYDYQDLREKSETIEIKQYNLWRHDFTRRTNRQNKSVGLDGMLGEIEFHGDVIVTSLTAEPETIHELETSIRRLIKRESDWSFFRCFRKPENFEPYDAGLLMIYSHWV